MAPVAYYREVPRIAVWVTASRKYSDCGPKPVKAGIRHKRKRQNTNRKEQDKTNANKQDAPKAKHTKTAKPQKQNQTTNSRNAIPETQLGSRWDCMPDSNSPRGVGTNRSYRLLYSLKQVVAKKERTRTGQETIQRIPAWTKRK